MNVLVVILGVAAIVGVSLWLSYRQGRSSVIVENNKTAKEVSDEQAQIAVDRPSKSDVVDELRRGSF